MILGMYHLAQSSKHLCMEAIYGLRVLSHLADCLGTYYWRPPVDCMCCIKCKPLCLSSALGMQAVDSWIEKLDVADLRPLLSALFSRYVDPTLEYCRRNFKYVVPIPAISQVMSICKILESILPQVCPLLSGVLLLLCT